MCSFAPCFNGYSSSIKEINKLRGKEILNIYY